MSNSREDLPVCTDGDGDTIKITAEELQGIWETYLLQENDQQKGEFTKREAAEMWGMNLDTTYDRLEKMVDKGLLEKRAGKRGGKRVTFYRKVI